MCRSITRCRPPFKPATCVAAAAAAAPYKLFNYFAIHVQSQTIKAILIRTILLCAPNCNLANVPPSPNQFSCTSCFICMLWQAHVVWQIQQLVLKLRIRIYPFLLHIPRRTWSIIRRRFLKTVTLPALELSKRITLKRLPLSSSRPCWPTLVASLLCATHVATLECWQHFNCTEKQ